MTLVPTLTVEQIEAHIQRLACCIGNMTFVLTDSEARGIETCDCSWGQVQYLVGVKKVLESFVPAGAVVNLNGSLTATFNLQLAEDVHDAFITVNGTTVYLSTPHDPLANTRDLIIDILANISTYTAYSNGTYNLNVVLPSGSTIVLNFQSEIPKKDWQYTLTTPIGQYTRTEAMNCLTNAQAQELIEQSTEICGCQDCGSTADAPPQPGAVIVYQRIGPRIIYITAGMFSGGNYQSGLLVGLSAGTNFNVYAGPGANGSIIYPGSGIGEYQFVSATGTISGLPPDSYMIEIYNN